MRSRKITPPAEVPFSRPPFEGRLFCWGYCGREKGTYCARPTNAGTSRPRPPSPLKRVRGCALRRAEFVDQERAPAPALVRPAREALAVVPGSGLSVGLRPCPCVAAPARRTVTRRRAAPPRVRRSSPSAPAPAPALLPPRPHAACPARGTTETANKGL